MLCLSQAVSACKRPRLGRGADIVAPTSIPLDVNPEKASGINVLKTILHGKFTQQPGADGPKQEDIKQTWPGGSPDE